MDVIEMTDADIYEVSLEALMDKLGPGRTKRFLRQCKPPESEIALVAWKLSKREMTLIQKKIYEARGAEQDNLEKRVELSDHEIYQLGLKAISGKLGPAGLMRFLLISKPGSGDYSVDRHKLSMPDLDTIVNEIQSAEEANQVLGTE